MPHALHHKVDTVRKAWATDLAARLAALGQQAPGRVLAALLDIAECQLPDPMTLPPVPDAAEHALWRDLARMADNGPDLAQHFYQHGIDATWRPILHRLGLFHDTGSCE